MTREELEKDLKEDQKAFCREYLLTWKKARSYMKAYPDATYESAAASATRLLKNDKIKAYIDYLKGDIEELTGVSKVRNVSELSKIAYSSIADLHDTWIDLADYEKLTDAQKAAIESIEHDKQTRKEGIYSEPVEVERVKVKLFPKTPAIQEINKMMGYHEPEEKIVGHRL